MTRSLNIERKSALQVSGYCIQVLLQFFKVSFFIRLISLLLCNFLLAHIASAQSQGISVKALLNRSQVVLGEQVEYKIEVRTPVEQPVTKWLEMPDTINHLEILKRGPVDSSIDGSVKTYTQLFTITGFDSGRWVIPSRAITISNKVHASDSVAIIIVPAPLKDSTYHDIRDIIAVPEEKTPWWYWVAAVLSILALAVLIWLWIKSRSKKQLVVPSNTSKLSPLEEALQQLRQLEIGGLTDKGEWKKYYSVLTDIFKRYIFRRFGTSALQKTTDELLVAVSSMLNKENLGIAAEALRISDAVKFAKYEPAKEQSVLSLKNIESTIKELDLLKQ